MLEINGNTVFCEIVGEGVPIITVHGFWVDHQLMKGCLERIVQGDNYKRVYFDLPGMGKTQTKKQFYHAEEMYDVIKNVIAQTIGNEKYILIGESYGGYLMRKLIQNTPEKILGAMFICPVIIPQSDKRTLPEHKLIYNEIIDDEIKSSKFYQDFIDMAVLSNIEIFKNYEEHIYSGVKNANTKFLELYAQKSYTYSDDVDVLKEPFTKPVLFVMGKQDSVTGYADAYTILDNYPRASFCVLDEAGHNLQIEKSKVFETLTKDWLERIKRNEN
jgi:pimeloyl-ACP methyl ester carboxylesterase